VSKTHKTTWKRFEAEVARSFGSTRTPLSGGNGRQTRSDSLHDRLFVEAKYRGKSAVCSLFRKVATSAARVDKTPVVAIRDKNHESYLLVIRPQDIHLLSSLAKDYEARPVGGADQSKVLPHSTEVTGRQA